MTLSGRRLPSWQIVAAIAAAHDVDPEDYRILWEEARAATPRVQLETATAPSDAAGKDRNQNSAPPAAESDLPASTPGSAKQWRRNSPGPRIWISGFLIVLVATLIFTVGYHLNFSTGRSPSGPVAGVPIARVSVASSTMPFQTVDKSPSDPDSGALSTSAVHQVTFQWNTCQGPLQADLLLAGGEYSGPFSALIQIDIPRDPTLRSEAGVALTSGLANSAITEPLGIPSTHSLSLPSTQQGSVRLTVGTIGPTLPAAPCTVVPVTLS